MPSLAEYLATGNAFAVDIYPDLLMFFRLWVSYHTLFALTSTRKSSFFSAKSLRVRSGPELQIIASPPFTCRVWPVT